MKINYLLIPLFVVLVAVTGSQITGSGMGWYKGINLPAWTPAGSVIGIVWTIIFILSAVSALIFWNKAPRGGEFRWTVAIFVLNGLLNAFWSFLFFGQHLLWASVFDAGLLAISVLLLIRLLWTVSKTAACLLLPYLVWASFATFLTYQVWQLNLI